MSKKSLLESVSLDELKQMYDNGMSCVEIANAVGVSDKTIYRHLQGHTNRHGGKYSRRIPPYEIHKNKHECENTAAVRNAVNACLVVQERTITLKGTVGEYLVEPSKKIVTANIGGNLINLDFDIIAGLIEELKAIGRNIESVAIGNEMW